MRSLKALIWRNLTAHALRSILTALAITLGVAMVLAASIVGQAAGRSASELSEEGPRVDLEIFSRDGAPFDDSVLDTLRASPDVERVSPSLRVEVELVLSTVEGGIEPEIAELTLLGIDPESYTALHQPELANGDFLDGSDTILIKGNRSGSIVLPMAIAIDNGLNVGDEVTLAADGREVTLTVVGRLRLEQDVTALDEANVAYVPLEAAQSLRSQSGQIGRVEVVLRPGVDANQAKADLAAQLSDDLAVVQVTDGDSGTFSAMAVQVGLAIVGVIILFAAAFVIMNAFAMSVTGRTHEIGALRALGMTRRQVMVTVLAEAGLLGLTGAALGLLTGVGLAWGVMRVRGTLDNAIFAVPWWGIAASVAVGLTVTLIGALQPARRASRISPLTALRTTGAKSAPGWYERRSGRAGGLLLLVLLLGLPATALILQPDFFTSFAFLGVGIVGLLLGTVLLMPALVQPAARLVRPTLVRWFGTTGRLAADNLTRNKLRTVLTTGALTVGLTTIIATSTLLTVSLKGGLNVYFGLFHEDCAVIPDIPALLASGEVTIENSLDMPVNHKLDPALVETVTELDVGEVVYYGFAPIQDNLSTFLGAPGVFVHPEIFLPLGNFDFFEGDADSALEMMRRGRALLLIPVTAERLGVGVGDTIPVQTPHGEVDFTVAGIGGTSTNFTVFSYADGETYFDLSGPSWLGIAVPPGRDVDATLTLVQETIEPFEDVVVFDMRESGVGGLLEVVDRLKMLLNALLLLAVVVAGLGVVNTMVINVAERGREIALLRAVGATQRQVRRSVVTEAATLGLMAALIATALGLITLALYAAIVLPDGATSVGMRVNWETVSASLLPALRDLSLSAALSLIFGPLVAALAAYYPAKQAAALDIVEATRSERVALKRTKAQRPEGRRRMIGHAGIARSLAWTLAWRSLSQHRLRTTLTALAVALGAATVVAADVISAALLNSLAGSEDAQKFMTGLLEQLGATLQMIGVGITLAAGFLIFNAFAMAVTQRRRQIGSLRALGMTRRQVLRLVLVESLAVGGLGTLFGLVAGPLLGKGAIALMKAILGEGLFVFSASNPSLSSLLLATALGMIIALLSALIPAWQAARVSPLVALRECVGEAVSQRTRRRASLQASVGIVVAVALFVYLSVAPPGEWVAYPWDQILAGGFVLIWLVGWGLIAPTLIGGLGRWTRGPLAARWGAVGRLAADNLRRGRGRVTLTTLTLVVGLTMIIGMTGFISFTGGEFLGPSLTGIEQLRLLIIAPFDVSAGMSAYSGLDTIELPPELTAEVDRLVEGRARVADKWHFTIVPELSFFGSSYFSFVTDPRDVEQSGDAFFTFIEGDWETAMPILEEGCGVLLTPLVASKNGVALGETFEVSGADGLLACTVAGIGRTYVNASIIGLAAKNEFAITNPFMLQVIPRPGVDRAGLKADLAALLERYPDAHLLEPEGMYEAQLRVIDAMPDMLNALLLLAILAAALGVVNTTMMSVSERWRELGLLRAVGATRRQVMRVVTGEAALMGVIGGGLGLVVGVGVVVIIVVTYGGNSWGVPDLDLWGAAWRSVQPALGNGLVGLIAAPFICAGAAWLPVRGILRGSAIETMKPARNPKGFKKPLGFIRLPIVVMVCVLELVAIPIERRHVEDTLKEDMVASIKWIGQAASKSFDVELSDLTAGMETRPTFEEMIEMTEALDLARLQELTDQMRADKGHPRDDVAYTALVDEEGTILLSDQLALIGEDAVVGEAVPSDTQIEETTWRGEEVWVASTPLRRGRDGERVSALQMALRLDRVEAFLDESRNLFRLTGLIAVLAGQLDVIAKIG